MERWKQNVIGLLVLFGIIYGLYLLALYEASGGTMTVSEEMPEWTFPLFVGVFIFGIAFIGGWAILAITDSEMAEKKQVILQLLSLGVLLGTTSTIGAFVMTGYLERTSGAVLILATVVVWALVLRAKSEAVNLKEPITDERTELIELKSWALAGQNMTFVASISLLLVLFHIWNPDAETLSFLLLATWSFSMIGARIYYGGRI
ncbi:hypothetical protein [Thermococcus sp.]